MKKSEYKGRKEALTVQIRTVSASFLFSKTYLSKKRKFFSALSIDEVVFLFKESVISVKPKILL